VFFRKGIIIWPTYFGFMSIVTYELNLYRIKIDYKNNEVKNAKGDSSITSGCKKYEL
jgi:hypothetical protein